MTDRPILFSPPMVRALLSGQKTQTRRILKLRGFADFSEFAPSNTDGYQWHFRRADMVWNDITHDELLKLFSYQLGDRLWVKETWRTFMDFDKIKPSLLLPGTFIQYIADDAHRLAYNSKTRVSIFMPRWASRLTLTVTDVRIERLQDISKTDARAEGIVPCGEGFALTANGELWGPTAKQSYLALWDDINGEWAHAVNPWIVAVSFDVAHRNIDL